MGVRILAAEGKTALYDSVSGTAFGPVFDDEHEAERFSAWVQQHHGDPRDIREDKLAQHHRDWLELQADR